MRTPNIILKGTRKFDLVCHECDTELDHNKLVWRQKKSIEFDDGIDNKRHSLSIPTCSKELTEHLMEVQEELVKFKEEIKYGVKPKIHQMLMQVLQDQNIKNIRNAVYIIYISAEYIKLPKGKKSDPEAEHPYITFGNYEFVYVSDCPNCGSLLETPWRGVDSIKATKLPGSNRSESDITKCRKCFDGIEHNKQFWYIYFTKDKLNKYNAHIVTVCQKCKFEHHHKSGHNLALRFIK